MLQSESIGELAKALAAAQGEFTPVAKNKTAKIPTKTGAEYSYKYADLADVVEMGSKILSKHGIAVMQFPECSTVESVDLLTTIVMHESGEYIQGTMRIRAKDDTAQAQGSAITYGRRYAYGGSTGLVTDEDDDGNAASKPAQPKPVQTKPKPVNRQTGEIVTRPSPLRAVTPDELSAAQAKKYLIDYFEGVTGPLQAKAEAIKAWGDRGSSPISKAELDGILTLFAFGDEPPREDEG